MDGYNGNPSVNVDIWEKLGYLKVLQMFEVCWYIWVNYKSSLIWNVGFCLGIVRIVVSQKNWNSSEVGTVRSLSPQMNWLVVEPLWRIWVRQWEGWHPIYEMENKKSCLKPPSRWNHFRDCVVHLFLETYFIEMKLIIFAGFSDILILILESDFIASWKRIWKFEMSGIILHGKIYETFTLW